MIMLGVENIARSVVFYRDTLALKLQNQSAEFAFFSAGGVTLGLNLPLGQAVQPPVFSALHAECGAESQPS